MPAGEGFMISVTTEPSLDMSSPATHIKSFPQALRISTSVDPMSVSSTPFVQFPWYVPETLKGFPPRKFPPLTVRSTTNSSDEISLALELSSEPHLSFDGGHGLPGGQCIVPQGFGAERVPLPMILVDMLNILDLCIMGVSKGLGADKVPLPMSLVDMLVMNELLAVTVAETVRANVGETTAEVEGMSKENEFGGDNVGGGGKRVLLIVSGGSETGPDGNRLLSNELKALPPVVDARDVVRRFDVPVTLPLEG